MYGEAKKLHLIEEILKIENDEVLQSVAMLIASSKTKTITSKNFDAFAGVLTDKEADDFEKIIDEGCEIIYADEWK